MGVVKSRFLLEHPIADSLAGSRRKEKNCRDSIAISVLNHFGQAAWRREMSNLVRYRAMESLCRQKAVFRPHESWRLLAEAEMWHHKAQEEMASHHSGRTEIAPDQLVDLANPEKEDLLLAS